MLPDVAEGTAARSVTAIEKSPAAGPPSGSVAVTASVTFVRCSSVPPICTSVVASSSPPIEDQTLGERVARLVQQQNLENTARQVAAAEDQRGVVVVPRFMIADVSAAVHQQFQPLGQRPSGDGQHREILLRLQDFQDTGRVPRRRQVEAFGLTARHRAFGVVAFARMGREAQTAHAAVKRAKRVDHLVAVVLHHARDLDRPAVVSQRLEGHAAVVAVDQVASFGEERDVEVETLRTEVLRLVLRSS